MANQVKISIVTISFNNEADIESTIKSVVEQTYSNIEYIVIDGGSTDNTVKIIDLYSDYISYIVSEPDNGMYEAINKGISYATGDVIGLIHAGDQLFSNDVIGTIAASFNDPELEAVYGDSILVNKYSNPIRINKSKDFSRLRIRGGWMPSHQSIYMRKERFVKYGAYRNDLGGSGDYEFFIRQFYKHPINARHIDLFIVRFSLGGMSTTNYHRVFDRQRVHVKCWILNDLKPPMFLIPFKLFRKVPQFLRGVIQKGIVSNNQKNMRS